jgi:hypothetical protein
MKFEKYKGKEEDLQKAVARFLDTNRVLWFHCPNEIKAAPSYLKKRRMLGVKSGVPDVCILEPNKNYSGLFIELKVGYNKPSEKQNEWIKKLEKRGYKTLVSYSLDEVIDVVNRYLNNEK